MLKIEIKKEKIMNQKLDRNLDEKLGNSDFLDGLVGSTIQSLKSAPKKERVQYTVYTTSATTKAWLEKLEKESGKKAGAVISELIDRIAAKMS